MDGAPGSDMVVGDAAAAAPDTAAAAPDQLMLQAPGVADPSNVPKKSRAEKRAAADAMSPGHLAATTALAPSDRRLQHALIGVDKEFAML